MNTSRSLRALTVSKVSVLRPGAGVAGLAVTFATSSQSLPVQAWTRIPDGAADPAYTVTASTAFGRIRSIATQASAPGRERHPLSERTEPSTRAHASDPPEPGESGG